MNFARHEEPEWRLVLANDFHAFWAQETLWTKGNTPAPAY
jgi:hypothetical protein